MELANSIITLQPGMYILRHPKTGLPPISISRAAGKPEHNGRIEALYTPNTDGGILRDGRDCIVMQVLNAPVELLVTAYLDKPGATVPALKVDKIALEAGLDSTATPIEIPPNGITLIGHIERRGNVIASNGTKLGEVSSELRLEGFQIMWPDKPEGVDLAYGVNVEGAGQMPSVTSGSFAGTRNMAGRIIGLKLSLIGPKAESFALEGCASFSGGYSTQLVADKLISGPSGLEHLTGLELEVLPKATGTKAPGPWEASTRTKVFRAAKRGKTVDQKKR